MAPPQLPNASHRAAASIHTTRQGLPKPQKLHDESHEDTIDFQTEAMDVDDQSQESQYVSPQELISSMMDGARKRRTAKKKAVVESYSDSSTSVEDAINTLFNEHEEKASSAHEAQLARLEKLLAQKAKLEEVMEAKLKSLRASYDAHSRDLELVLGRRIQDLK